MSGRFKWLVLASLLAAQGCTTLGVAKNDWPANLPDRDYFSQIYASDAANAAVQTEDDYLRWVRRFYEGSEYYAWGFLDLVALLLHDRSGEDAERVKHKLDAVGMQIGGEWAKDRRVKSITTRMLSTWGNTIQATTSLAESESVIDQVSADVAAVLAGTVAEDQIGPERYGIQFDAAFAVDCSDPVLAGEGGC